MLDIGQGDAFVIELPYRKGVILIDAGASFSFKDFKPSERVYSQIIQPYFYYRGITDIDAIIVSHEDIDHNGSIPFIVEDFNVDRKSTRLNSSHVAISYAVFCLKKKIISQSRTVYMMY